MYQILLVEDDVTQSENLKFNLAMDGFILTHVTGVPEAWILLQENSYDVLLINMNLPDQSGPDLCENLREKNFQIPIIFLCARTDLKTVIRGINIGADDYIKRPCHPEELKARIAVVMKRQESAKTIIFEGLKIDLDKRLVTIKNKILALGRKEFEILIMLAKRAGNVVTRENIISNIQESNDIFDRTIDSHMSHLRRKIREVAGDALKISSIYGVGYKLEWSIS